MQYPQPGWNPQGYPPSSGAGYPAGHPGAHQGAAWGAPAYPGGYGGYPPAAGMYPPAGMYPQQQQQQQQPGMYPQAGMYHGAPPSGYNPQAGYPPAGMYPNAAGAGVPPQALKRNVELKPAVNPVDAMFGKKDTNPDPNAGRARRVSNPPPVQPTPQESKPQPKRAPNYDIDLSTSEDNSGLGVPGTPSSHSAKPSAPVSQPSGTPPTSGLHGSVGHNPTASGPGGYVPTHSAPTGMHGQYQSAPGQFPPGGAHPGQFPGVQKPGFPTAGVAPGPHQYPPAGGALGPHQYPPAGAQGQYPPTGGFGYPPNPAYGGYGVAPINKGGSFFLPPGAATNASTPSLAPTLAPGFVGPTAGFTAPSPTVPPSPVATPVATPSLTRQGSFQQGLLGAPGIALGAPLHSAPQQSLLPHTFGQPGPTALHQSAPLQSSPTIQPISSPLLSTGPLQPGGPLQPIQPAMRSNSIPVLSLASTNITFQPSPPRAPLQHATSASSPVGFSQFHTAGTDDWAGAEFTSAAVSDDFGFSEFQGASPTKAPTPQLSPQQPEKDLFGFDEPQQSPPARLNKQNSLLDFGQPTEIASPKISRSTKHLKHQESEPNFFGTPVANIRHNNANLVFDEPASTQTQPTIADPAAAFMEPVEPTPAPEPPKKPASAIDSMMEDSLFKVTHKPPPMAKVASVQAQQQTPQPAQPQPQQSKSSAKKFDWSSTNYRDIFGESESAPAPNPLAAQEQFEGFVSAADSAGAGDFEFGAFEGSSSADPFASSSPPSFTSTQSTIAFPPAQTSPFGSESGFGASPLFPEDASFGAHASPQVHQPRFSQSHQPDEQFSFPTQSQAEPVASLTLAPSPFAAPTPTLKPTSPAPSSVFPSESFSSSELFSANQLSPHDHFGFPSTTSPFSQPVQPPAVTNSAAHAPSPTPTSYPNSEPAFSNFFPSERRNSIPPTPANSVVKEEEPSPFGGKEPSPFGDNSELGNFFGSNSGGIPATPANSVVGPPRPTESVQVESEPAFSNFFDKNPNSTGQASDHEASAFGDFFGQSKGSAPPTPANTVVQSDLLNFPLMQLTFGEITKLTKPLPPIPEYEEVKEHTPLPSLPGFKGAKGAKPLPSTSTPSHARQPIRTASLPVFGILKPPPAPTNSIASLRSSINVPSESFGAFYGENSRSAAPSFTHTDPTFESFKSTSVPPTPANSVDKDAKINNSNNNNNNNNFFSDPFGAGSNNLKPSSSTPATIFNYSPAPSPSSSVIAPQSNTPKSNGDWGLTSSTTNDDYFGSPFGDATSPSPSTTQQIPSSVSPVSSVANAFAPSTENFSAFDTSFGSAPVFPMEDSFGKSKANNDSEFSNFSSFNNGFGDSEFGDFTSSESFGTFSAASDFGNSAFDTGFSSPQSPAIEAFPSSTPSLASILKSLVDQERLQEAAECQNHVKNDTQPSQQELAAWSAPNPANTTIAQLKQRLLAHTSQDKVLNHFAQFEKQSLSTVAMVNIQAAIESQTLARQFVTAIIEWQDKWEKQLASCAVEVATAHGLATDIRTSSGLGGWDSEKEVFSQDKWSSYFRAIVEVYRVACRLTAAAQHFHVPPSPQAAKFAASWSVLTALLRVDNINIDYSDHWDHASHAQVECALCHVPISEEASAPWDGATYHLSCANMWANRVSTVPPHVK